MTDLSYVHICAERLRSGDGRILTFPLRYCRYVHIYAERSGRICHFLTHWGRVTHIYVAHLTIIASDNGLSPSRCQAIIWTNAGILLIRPLGTNLSEILIEIHTFSFKKMYLKMSSAKRRPFCLGFNVLRTKMVWSTGFRSGRGKLGVGPICCGADFVPAPPPLRDRACVNACNDLCWSQFSARVRSAHV